MACAGPVDLGVRESWGFFLVQLFSPTCSHLDLGYLKIVLLPEKKRKECFLTLDFQSAGLIAAEELLAVLKAGCHSTT